MKLVIEVENLSKFYSLGKVGTGSFRQDVAKWVNYLTGKEDPFFSEADGKGISERDFIWALWNVSFDVREGEVLGIIGRNGAGKSTLLKILSKVVKPTHGAVRGRGRVSSLLEIGTGFHNELSGRENIFLNGHFLGMNKQEIEKKFDEIVAFSGVENFIDTPVKRYSSGMYVRLAFAVAAHLQPDILIVDEVLAVGDAEFQKRCLGKIHEVSTKQGRTVLFVSHNMQAVLNLCDRAMLLNQGRVADIGITNGVVNRYLKSVQNRNFLKSWTSANIAPGTDKIRIKSVELIPSSTNESDPIDIRTPIKIKFQFWNLMNMNLCVGIQLWSQSGECIFDVNSPDYDFQKGLITGECEIPGNFLNDGSYFFNLIFVKDTSVELFNFEECLAVDIEDYRENINWYGKWPGYVRPKFPFELHQTEISDIA